MEKLFRSAQKDWAEDVTLTPATRAHFYELAELALLPLAIEQAREYAVEIADHLPGRYL